MKRRENPKGFTLVELLVAIAVIALLAALIFAVFFVARDKSRESVCLAQLRQIGQALKMYQSQWNELPPMLSALYPQYVSDKRVFLCPNAQKASPGQPSGTELSTTYGYYYEVAQKVSKLPADGAPPGSRITWEEAYALRGEELPVVVCQLHGDLEDHAGMHGVKPLVMLLLRMDGSVKKVMSPKARRGQAIHWYDF